MSINVGDNFSYQGKKFLDNRQSFKTITELMNYNNVPEGFVAYCEENEKQYQYKNGKWNVYAVAGSTNVDTDNLATKDELNEKFDDVEVNEEESVDGQTALDFYANGSVKKTIYFSGGGGSTGSPYISTSLAENIMVGTDTDFELIIDYASPNQGKGTLKVFINDMDSLTTQIQQGESTTIVPHELLSKGTNKMVVYVIDRLGVMSNSLTFYVRYGGTEVVGDFDSSLSYEVGSTIRYYFIPTALDTSLSLTFYMNIDGAIQPGVACYSDVRGYFTFPNNLDVGAHYCEAWVEDSNGGKSNVLIFNLILLDNQSLVVASNTKTVTLEEGSQLSLEYRVYMHNNTSFITKTYIDEELVNTGSCTLAPAYYKSTNLTEGMHIIKVEVWNLDETVSDYVTWTVIVTPSTYTMLEPVNAGSLFIASATNRTNSDENRDRWIGHDQDGAEVEASLVNFAFNNESGWVDDTILITGRSHIEVPIRPLAENAKYGFTLDIEFLTKPIGVDNAEVLNLWDDVNNCGIKITTEELILQSKTGNKCDLYFTEEQLVSAIFVIDRNEKTAKIYLNGVMCEAFALSDYTAEGQSFLEDFTVDKNIILGGEDRNGYSAIKNLRVYNIALTTDEILNNFMSNERDKTAQRNLVEFQKGNDLPTLTVYCDFSGLGKDDKKPCDIFYNSPDVVKYGESFALQGKKCQLQYQGTSSMAYPIKNYRLNLRDENGKKWYYPFPGSQPECRFTLKADFMSSGHWTNTGLTKWVNDNLYNYDYTDEKTMNPAKWWAIQNDQDPNNYRECINGFPCRLILVNDGNSALNAGQYEPLPGNTKDMGVFNFNLDKDCENSLGFTIPDFPNAVSMEVTANSDTSAGAFISYANSGVTDISELDYIKQSFEVRYFNEDLIPEDEAYMEFDWYIDYWYNGSDPVYSPKTTAIFGIIDDEIVVNTQDNSTFRLSYYTDTEWLSLSKVPLESGTKVNVFDEEPNATHFTVVESVKTNDFITINGVRYNYGKELAFESTRRNEPYAVGKNGLKRLLDWVDNSSDEEFVRDFEQYFHKDYTLRYYLLVITLGMVDNLGKNMMLDSYDGKVWMPRFYDCDTICSYDNSGQLKFDVDIEMAQGYWNTSSSRLWTRLRDLFYDELIEKYNNMRQNGMSFESFMSYFYGEQIAKIPQKYYNMDFDVKYAPFINQYAGMAHGDTYEHLKRWLKNRLIFTDSLFDYAPSYTNDMLTIRANTTELMSLTIETYTPVYQHVSFYNGHMAKEKIGKGQTFTFSGYAQAATDQEVLIYGGSNVKRITGISTMNPNSMLIGGATRLVELDISDCPILVDINSNKANLSAHTYLNKLDISNCPQLGGILRVNNSPLLQEINAKNTAITALMLPASVRNLETLRLPNTISELTLNDGNMLREIEFEDGVALQKVTMVNCNDISTVTNFDLTSVTELTLNNSYAVADELIMRDTVSLNLNNMSELERLVFIPNFERETFNHTQLKNDPVYTVTTFNCPKLKTFMTTAPQRLSYNGEETDIRPNSVFSASTLDISNTQIDTIKFLCTTDIDMLKLPPTISNFYCDSAFDIDTNIISDADYDTIHHTLIDAYCMDQLTDIGDYDIIPSSSDGSLIFSMYSPSHNTIAPGEGVWDLYGLEFDDFFTFGMNNDIQHENDILVMPVRHATYNVAIENATIRPKTLPTMLYPSLINEEDPIEGTLDYNGYEGTSLDYAFAYVDISKNINITLNSEALSNITSTHNVLYESNFSFDHPRTIAKYISSERGVRPTFPDGYDDYSIIEEDLDDGTYRVTVGANSLTNLPTSISFNSSKQLLKVNHIASCITSYNNAFMECKNLTEVTISDTSNVINMNNMFRNCASLSSLNVSDWNTDNVTTIGSMFMGCSSLTSLDLSGWNVSKVTNMNYIFANCSALTSLDVSGWKTGSVTNMASTFYNCSALNSLDVSGWDTGNVTNMSQMFQNCTSLTSLDLSDWNTSKVTNISNMFGGCTALVELNLSNWTNEQLTLMNNVFTGCSALRVLNLSNFKTPKVTTMNMLFGYCSALAELDLSSFDVSKVTNMTSMFEYIPLQTLNISNWELNTGVNLTYMFRMGSTLERIDMFNSSKSSVEMIVQVLPASTGSSLMKGSVAIDISLVANDWMYRYVDPMGIVQYLTTDPSLRPNFNVTGNFNAYTTNTIDHGDGIYEVIIARTGDALPNKVSFQGANTLLEICEIDTSNITDMAYMFQNCTALSSLDVSGWDTSNVTTMYYMFYGCTSLTSLDLSGLDTSKVTNMGRTFSACTALTSLDVSGWDTGEVTNMQYMFFNCEVLTSLDLSGWDVSKVTNMTSVFAECTSLTSLDLTGWKTSSVTNMTQMFYNCTSLTSLDLPEWDASEVTDMAQMFYNCNLLTSLNVSGWKAGSVTNMSHLFYRCKSLTSLDLSGWDTSSVTNISCMFQQCSLLNSLDISDWDTGEVTNMSFMFNACTSLVDFSFLKTWTLNKVTNMQSTFNGCGAEYIDLSNKNMPATNFRECFSSCPNLKEVYTDGWLASITNDTINTERSYHIQYNDPLLTTDITLYIGSKRKLTSYHNNGCTSLPAVVDLSSMDTSKISTIGLATHTTELIGVHSEVGFEFSVRGMPNFVKMRNCHMKMVRYGFLYYGGGGSTLDWIFETTPTSTNYMYENWPNNDGTIDDINYNLSLKDNRWTASSLVSFLECLYDYAAEGRVSEKVLNFGNNLNKLTDDQIAIATNKGWTLV